MSDEYLDDVKIGCVRVLNASNFPHGHLEIALQILQRHEANGMVEIKQLHRESRTGNRELKLISYTRLK